MKVNLIITFSLFLFLAGCYQPVSSDTARYGSREDSNETQPTKSALPSSTVEPEASDSPNPTMTSNTPQNPGTGGGNESGFDGQVSKNLSRVGSSFESLYDRNSEVEKRVYLEYGAVFLSAAMPPDRVMFVSETEVGEFQRKAGSTAASVGGVSIELQPDAMTALKAAVAEGASQGVKISPRGGATAAKRSYAKTLELWNSRVNPALKHWQAKGRLNQSQVGEVKSLPIKEQVAKVLEYEKQGIYFNTFFDNSILYSVAAPGTSQHLSMLALDVAQFSNSRVQQIMASHGWFRTVQNDAPHFTYIGKTESELPSLGLTKVTKKDGDFWIPAGSN